jgi:hypothetical protein
MYSKLVALIRIRSNENIFLQKILDELSIVCEKIIIDDRDDLLGDMKLLNDDWDVDIYKSENYDLRMYGPDWILALYADEVPTKNFRFMKDSLCSNEYVNIWESNFLTLWNDEKTYREDKLWGAQRFPFLYKWIPEIDYKFTNGCLVPVNQPGPKEKCPESVLSYRYLRQEDRLDIYDDYLKDKDNLNYVTQLHYESLLDENIILKFW